MKLINMPNGELQFSASNEAEEAVTTKEIVGGVTVNTTSAGKPAKPAFFEATFFINCAHEVDGISVSNIFHMKTVVPVQSSKSRYSDIEDQACRTLPALLRDLAGEIEKDIARVDASNPPSDLA